MKTGALTLENLKLHDNATRQANQNFLPRMDRLMQKIGKVQNRPTTQYSGKFSIFEALYDLEVGAQKSQEESTAGTYKTQTDNHSKVPT